MAAELRTKLEDLPKSSGVYLFKGTGGEILYVGKARSLRSRVRSYFQNARVDSPRLDRLVERIEDVEVVVTDTEREALVLENSLIKTHKPRFNVLLRDDKNHPYLKLTLNETYPRLYVVRQPANDGDCYSGPYVPASLARKTANLVHRLFGVRNCTEKLDGKRARPCLQYQIKRCVAPCVDTIISLDDYHRAVDDARLFLEGKNDDLITSLRVKMYEAADRERFEEAARLRDNLRTLEELSIRQKMAGVRGDESDVFGFFREGNQAVLQVFSVRSGKVVDRDSFLLEDLDAHDDASLVEGSLRQYYELGRFLPSTIHVPVDFPERALVSELLSGQKGSKVEVLVPRRGTKKRMVDLVSKNARLAYDLDFREEGRQVLVRLETLAEVLGMSERPERIEGFDISNIQASEVVASMVVFERGQPKRGDYRKYKIRGLEQRKPDDFASMREVVLRRYRRVLEEGADLPDLVLIDGGKGQLGAAISALEELGLSHLPTVSLAKKEEWLFRPGHYQPLVLDRHSPALQLLQRVRDEAHRFAVTFHRQQRKARDFSSSLESVPGIGPKKRRRLLTRFGSVKGIKAAELAELREVLGQKLGEKVYRHVREMM
ncbi:MAG TPA: excinuclease ABC subunit UvrC [Vicinamibacteria bacterium]|nr:excinuclease ABC subunit UvrC [Vicinamibacteria bacterium]